MIEFDPGPSDSLTKSSSRRPSPLRVKVLGIGGAGCSILSRLNFLSSDRIEFFALNSDRRSLEVCEVEKKVQLGESIVGGWGAGGNPQLGRQIALGEKNRIKEILKGASLLFLVSGLGKGTGTGVSPVVAQLAREMSILTVGFAILPFSFEGEKRAAQAREGLRDLEKAVDALMVISNDDLLNDLEESSSLKEGFRTIDGILEKLIQTTDNLLFHSGLISVDFADLKSLLERKGHLSIAIGTGKGEEAAQEAARDALSFPLIEKNSLKEAQAMLIHIMGGEKLSLSGVREAVLNVEKASSPKTEVIFGAGVDERLSDEAILTLLVIGKEESSKGRERKRSRLQQEELDLKAYEEDDLDIPTFLRKRKN